MKKVNKKNFTLIELLVVVSIIALLVGMLLPAVIGVLQSAAKTKARGMANAIVIAIKQYEVQYGVWPVGVSTDGANETMAGDYNTFFTTLYGDNPKNTAFLEIDADSGTNGYLDPWGNNFTIGIDGNYDREVKGFVSTNLKGDVFVFSSGPDGTAKNADDVYSWK